MKKNILGVVKGSRQSSRLSRIRSNLSSSRRSQALINTKLGFIKRPEDFNNDTPLAYLHFFKAPMPHDNIANLVEIAGSPSPAQLQLPNAELQAILQELAGRMA
ncbi:hypothetical protein D1007_19246 [Hordeum vulgare]|nr:hypothetical protein D1007_19246 [Hordeum vulgare]